MMLQHYRRYEASSRCDMGKRDPRGVTRVSGVADLQVDDTALQEIHSASSRWVERGKQQSCEV